MFFPWRPSKNSTKVWISAQFPLKTFQLFDRNHDHLTSPLDWVASRFLTSPCNPLPSKNLQQAGPWEWLRLVCSESRPRTLCLTWFPAGYRPWSSANFRELRGQSNVPTSALIEMGVLCFSSATSCRSAIVWHQNWIFEIWHLAVGICERLSGCRIRWGVARRFGVIWLALSPFPGTRLPVKLDHRIMPSFHRSFGPYPDFLIINCKYSRIQL
jgi:hypothetical protein